MALAFNYSLENEQHNSSVKYGCDCNMSIVLAVGITLVCVQIKKT